MKMNPAVLLLALSLLNYDLCIAGWSTLAGVITAEYTEYIWHCTGSFSTLAYRDCQGSYYNTTGCYFKIHFSQYRPCSEVCNNAVVGSIDEEKCKGLCPDYLNGNCKIILGRATTNIPVELNDDGKSILAYSGTTMRQQSFQSTILPLCLSVSVVLGVIVAVVVLCRHKLINKSRTQQQQFSISVSQGYQECHEEVSISLSADIEQCAEVDCEAEQNCSSEKKIFPH